MTNIHFRMLGPLIAGAGLIAVLSAATQACHKNAGHGPLCFGARANLVTGDPLAGNRAPLANVGRQLQCETDLRVEMSCPYLATMLDVSRSMPRSVGSGRFPGNGALA
jgi:hypothetical protein